MRPWLVPEVVQTSEMDCGPAALASLLRGVGVTASYRRLRDVCRTDVDGTSIDALEDVAAALGVEARQLLTPADHVTVPAGGALPAIAVTELPTGFPHFVVVWRRHGPWLQVMDPATGRRFERAEAFAARLWRVEQEVPAAAWRDYASGPAFGDVLTTRLRAIGLSHDAAAGEVARAAEDEGWQALAALDAATRMIARMQEVGAASRRRGTVGPLLHRVLADPDAIPEALWQVTAAAEEGQVLMRGAVVLTVRHPDAPPDPRQLPPALAEVLTDAASRPVRELLALARGGGTWRLPAMLAGIVASAAGAVGLAVLLALVLASPPETAVAPGLVAGLLAVAVGLLLLDVPLLATARSVGRTIELGLRRTVLRRLPDVPEREVSSRPASDMTLRSHTLHVVRDLPTFGSEGLRVLVTMLLTLIGMALLHPAAAVPIAVAGVLIPAAVLGLQPLLVEREHRVQTQEGALTVHAYDALRGGTTIRAHVAGPAVRYEHDQILHERAAASRRLVAASTVTVALPSGLAVLLVAALLASLDGVAISTGRALLLVYWAMVLSVLATDLAILLRAWPAVRTATLRALDPLGAVKGAAEHASVSTGDGGMGVVFQGVTVAVGGTTVLSEVDLDIGPGEHVAVVGASGAGKSSLLGVLLGWHEVRAGTLRVDGQALTAASVPGLREQTAWVDPGVRLWNRTLAENLTYGCDGADPDELVSAAGLQRVVRHLPGGVASRLGEGGALVSGGEGQRVRFGRGLGRGQARLVLLDEAFRGLDRTTRRALLDRARGRWRHATILSVTHDVLDTVDFARVVVVHDGRVVEDGPPERLRQRPGGVYARMLADAAEVDRLLWHDARWRRWWLEEGRLAEGPVQP